MTSSKQRSLSDPIVAQHGATLVKTIRRFLPSAVIYWFGSRVDGTAKKNSDLDIAIDAGAMIDFAKMSNLREALSETSCPVLMDVVDIHTVDAGFRQLILAKGVKANS